MVWSSGVTQDNALLGNEQVEVANGSSLKLQTTVAAIGSVSAPTMYTNGQTAAATLTVNQMAGAPATTPLVPASQVFMYCNGSTSGSVTFTTPTVAAMVAAFTNWIVGTSYEFDVINAGTGNNVVLGAGTGWTITGGSATVANNVWRKYLVTLTSTTAITATGIEVGTYS